MKRRTAGRPFRTLRTVGETPAASRHLPLIHITSAGHAREILLSGQIEARTCPALKRDLAYFFVARPAYRIKDGDEKSDEVSRFPVAFFVDPTALSGPPFHVYPFDTGGALRNMFDEKADSHAYLEDYELEPTWLAVDRHINWGFGDVGGYFDAVTTKGIVDNVPLYDFPTRSFAKIAGIAASGYNMPDDRASTIEIAVDRHVRLDKAVTLAVVPIQLLEDCNKLNDELIETLIKYNVDFEMYEWTPFTSPEEYRAILFEVVRRRLERAGHFK